MGNEFIKILDTRINFGKLKSRVTQHNALKVSLIFSNVVLAHAQLPTRLLTSFTVSSETNTD